ncbi:MAG: transglutaminase family protein [Chlamydiota bacterium]
MIRWFCLFISLLFLSYTAPGIRAKYARLDPKHPSKNLAFYELYPHTYEGEKALNRAWGLMAESACRRELSESLSSRTFLKALHQDQETQQLFSTEELDFMEELGASLENRTLPGYLVWDLSKMRTFPPNKIDLARLVFLAEGYTKEAIRNYEALIDWMALQVRAQLPKNPSPQEKIYAINELIFHDIGFRFPANSAWEKDIDTYTALPSVIDSKRGVCLGVSILYLCIAQRIGLSLEAVTPPGHIYLRYRENGVDPINIETTARGIDVPCSHYKGLELEHLETKNLLEVVGLIFVNRASVQWQKKEHTQAVALYEKARLYLPQSPLVLDLLGYNHLFLGNIQEAKRCLKEAVSMRKEQKLSPNLISEDYMNGKASIEGIEAIFAPVDNTRDAILAKRECLKDILATHPHFQAGLLQYAHTYLQMGREKEAIAPLEELARIGYNPLTAHYYLAMIHRNRYNYKKSWDAFYSLVFALKRRDTVPKLVKEMERSLRELSPPPLPNEPTEEEKGDVFSILSHVLIDLDGLCL